MPPDRPSASDVPGEAHPRRALDHVDQETQDESQYDVEPDDNRPDDKQPNDASGDDGHGDGSDTPHSPSTPVRLTDLLAAHERRIRSGDGEQPDSDGHDWSWDLPPTPDAERPRWATSPVSGEAAAEATDTVEADRPIEPEASTESEAQARSENAAEAEQHAQPEQQAGPQQPEPQQPEPDREAGAPESGERDREGSQNQRSNGPDAWLTALQPAAEFAEHPTELLPTVSQPGDVPTGPDPAIGAAPVEAVPESIAQVGPAGLVATPETAPGSEGATQKKAPQPQQNKTGKKPDGPGGSRALALKGRQRFKLLQSVGPPTPRPDIPDQSHLLVEQRTDLAVRVTDLSITYRTSFEKKPTLRQAVVRLGRGQRAVREIKALQNISFEVRTGRSIGIIGRNGAGKSTLMRALAGILPPTSGTVEVWGRASTLLALGVGFNNSLSGRENIILGGLASGLSLDDIEDRANEIAEWTELGDFIDMPMRTYSSGMAARVAFAVAVHMEPDILMIDEGLSTGDAHFKDKASAKMSELRDKARAMFLVSHGLGSIKELCDEAIWIDKGHLMERGEPEEVVEKYLHHLKAGRRSTTFEDV